jgi:hypothetical protein
MPTFVEAVRVLPDGREVDVVLDRHARPEFGFERLDHSFASPTRQALGQSQLSLVSSRTPGLPIVA